MIHGNGRTWGWRSLARPLYRTIFALRDGLARRVEIVDGSRRYRFHCGTYRELKRAMGLFAKEPGTCAWINENVEPGEVFYDIGANIGVYSILASRRVGASGSVVSFEPHGPNFACLLENILANNLTGIVTPTDVALADVPGCFPFHYTSSRAGSSDSQLGSTRRAGGAEFTPRISALKQATSVDRLIGDGVLPPPDHVKIDVDGLELPILKGMSDLLKGPDRPRTIQVEINPGEGALIAGFMEYSGYHLDNKHYTRAGQRKIDVGGDPEVYGYNAVFASTAPRR